MKVILCAALLAVALAQTTPMPTTVAPLASGANTPVPPSGGANENLTTTQPPAVGTTQPAIVGTTQPAVVATSQPAVVATSQPAIAATQPSSGGISNETGGAGGGISSNMSSWAPIMGGNMSHVRGWTQDLFDSFADKDFSSFMQVLDEDTKFTVHGLDLPFAGEYKGSEIWDLIFKCEGLMETQSRPKITVLSVDDIKGISLVLMDKDVKLIKSGKQVKMPIMFLVRWSLATGKVQEIEAWLQDDKSFLEAYRTNAEKSFWKMLDNFSSQKKIEMNEQNFGKFFADNIEVSLLGSSNLLSKPKYTGKQGVMSMFQELAGKFGLTEDMSSSQQGGQQGGGQQGGGQQGGNNTGLRRQLSNESKDLSNTSQPQPVLVPNASQPQPVLVPNATQPQPNVSQPQPVLEPNVSQPQPVLEPTGRPIEQPGMASGQLGEKFQLLQRTWQMKLFNEIYHNRQYEVVGGDDKSVLIRWEIPDSKMIVEDIKGLTRFTYTPQGLLEKIEISLITPLRPWQLRPMPMLVFPQGQQSNQSGGV